MQCISPWKAGYRSNGDLTYTTRLASKELVGISFECRKCLPCRLNIAREKSVRAWHESQMHENSMFLTLTYSDTHLKSPKLHYEDFQLFMKKLRKSTDEKINYLVTGEYGEINKRPHWHAIIFNYRPTDCERYYISERGDQLYKSSLIDKLWGKNDPTERPNEIGEVTIDSAGYVARYASKKLIHGPDGTHDYDPIHKTSSRKAIGRTWIEKYHEHTFQNGYVYLPNGQKSKIPRYYVDWAKQHKTDLWLHYISEVRPKIIADAQERARKEELEYISTQLNYTGNSPYPKSRSKVKETILQQKFKKLMEHLKL